MKINVLACYCITILLVQFPMTGFGQEKQNENGVPNEQAPLPDPTIAHRLEMANKVLAGEKLDEKAVNESITKFKEFRKRLKAKYPIKPVVFTREDDALFYCQAYLMSIVAPGEHGGWPYRYEGVNRVYAQLKKELEKKDDTLIMAAIIIPAVNNNDMEYATNIYIKLHEKDPNLSKYAHQYIKNLLLGDPKFMVFSNIADGIAK